MNLNYRSDIDGLRAIAVISVIIYHINNHWLHGGFIGVDIFFVISGFLITKIIYADIVNKRFNFKDFYQRRINRILPTFFFIMFVTAFCSWYILLPEDFMLFFKSLKTTTYLWENMFFAKNTGGYWDLSAEKMPILHTWSLAVEEQFYILLPFLLLFLSKIQYKTKNKIFYFNKTSIIVILIFIAVLFFYLAQISPISGNLMKYNYYSLLTGRAGELLIGSIIGIITVQGNKYKTGILNYFGSSLLIKNVISLIGFITLLLSLSLLSKKFLFPSFWALIPTISTACIIYFYDNRTFVAKLLSYKPIVFIGKISFSLYLWHWPIIVLTRKYLYIENIETTGQYCFVVITTLILSLFTYYFIETPCRKNKKNFKFSLLFYYLLPAITIIGIYEINKKYKENIFNFRKNEQSKHFIFNNTDKWILGKNDFLFLGNAFNKTIEKLTLKKIPSEENLKFISQIFNKITNKLLNDKTKIVLFVAPNKSSIYPELLPETIKPSKNNYIEYYLRELNKNKKLITYYPLNILKKERKKDGYIYYRTDTHWNSRGAYIAFNNLLKYLKLPLLNLDFNLTQSQPGDLINISGIKNFKLHNDDTFSTYIKNEKHVVCDSESEISDGSFGLIENCFNSLALINQSVWISGDSFSVALRQYLNSTFKEVNYIGHHQIDDRNKPLNSLYDRLSKTKQKPDLIIIVIVERLFP